MPLRQSCQAITTPPELSGASAGSLWLPAKSHTGSPPSGQPGAIAPDEVKRWR